MMNGKLAGKVAIVTGAASGISRATALLFAEEGAFTVIADLDETGGEQAVAEAKEMGAGAEFHRVDVTDSAQVKTLIDDTLARHGSLDILVNGAAYQTETGPVADVTEEEWDSGLGLFLQRAFPGLQVRHTRHAERWGRGHHQHLIGSRAPGEHLLFALLGGQGWHSPADQDD